MESRRSFNRVGKYDDWTITAVSEWTLCGDRSQGIGAWKPDWRFGSRHEWANQIYFVTRHQSGFRNTCTRCKNTQPSTTDRYPVTRTPGRNVGSLLSRKWYELSATSACCTAEWGDLDALLFGITYPTSTGLYCVCKLFTDGRCTRNCAYCPIPRKQSGWAGNLLRSVYWPSTRWFRGINQGTARGVSRRSSI